MPKSLVEKTKNILTQGLEKLKIPEKQDIQLSDPDDLLIRKLNLRIREASDLLKTKLNNWRNNLKFFDGKHWEVAGITLPTYKADIVINNFFSAVRSLVAFETDTKPEAQVEARVSPQAPRIEEVRTATKKTEAMLNYRWDICQIPNVLTEIYYDRYIYDDGFGMYFWNVAEDDIDFEQIKPQEILRPPGATSIEDAEYIIVRKWRTKKWVEENYPEKAEDVKYKAYGEIEMTRGEISEKGTRENMVQVEHYFQDDIWIVKAGNIILEKKLNPFWEWRTVEEQEAEIRNRFKEVPYNWKPVTNHLIKPEKPIIQFKGYHLGGEFYSKSLVKQVAKLSFAINKRKCQIQDAADGMANPQWVVDPSVSDNTARRVTSESGLKIKVNPNMIRKEPGVPLPAFVFQDMIHTEQKFDDLIGHHEISRGATTKKRQTAKEALLLRESDITPVRLLMRNSEVAITKLLNGWCQLMKLFYDQPHYIGGTGKLKEEIGGEVLKREEIPDYLSILIKVGSSLPISKETQRREYEALFFRGELDPISFFKLMDYPNPEKLAYRLLNWKRGILSDEPPAPPGPPGPSPEVPPAR